MQLYEHSGRMMGNRKTKKQKKNETLDYTRCLYLSKYDINNLFILVITL